MIKRIILVNRTVYDDADVLPILKRAMQRAECEPTVVVILKHLCTYTKGMATSGRRYCVEHKGNVPNEIFQTNGGYVEIWIPRPSWMKRDKDVKREGYRATCDRFAGMLYEYAVHEFKHVADFQMKRFFSPADVPYESKEEENRARITETLAMLEVTKKTDMKAVDAIQKFSLIMQRKIRECSN